jgi:hypothetical protein
MERGIIREYRPSSELISTMLTLVWAIAGIYEEGVNEEGPSGGGVVVRGAGMGCVEGDCEGEKSVRRTGTHMPCDMLRTSESCLANRTFVIASHREYVPVFVAVGKEKNWGKKRRDLTGLLT